MAFAEDAEKDAAGYERDGGIPGILVEETEIFGEKPGARDRRRERPMEQPNPQAPDVHRTWRWAGRSHGSPIVSNGFEGLRVEEGFHLLALGVGRVRLVATVLDLDLLDRPAFRLELLLQGFARLPLIGGDITSFGAERRSRGSQRYRRCNQDSDHCSLRFLGQCEHEVAVFADRELNATVMREES